MSRFNLKKQALFIALFTFSCAITFAQERLTISGVVGTNYAITKTKQLRSIDINQNWYPGLSVGANASYRLAGGLAVETGVGFERIRSGNFDFPDNNTLKKIKTSTFHDYLNVPLNLSYTFNEKFGLFGGAGYRFTVGKEKGTIATKYTSEPYFAAGLFYNIDKLQLRASYSAGLRDGVIMYFPGPIERNKLLNFSVSYALWKL